ncbi:MAG: hypothetical protein JW958_05855 [Candidatus Eisenbacteria bacterium]|nr:hypothetical protein [Candidatus Eisenbacteria bacterium]
MHKRKVTCLALAPIAFALFLPLLSCSPPAFFMEPVHPTVDEQIHMSYRNLSLEELEAYFVRPYTGRTLMETSGTTSVLLYDYAYLVKRVGDKSGADQALRSMRERFIDRGISFRVVIWGDRADMVDLERWNFRLRGGDEGVFDPAAIEEVRGAELQEASIRGTSIWGSIADVTFPFRLDRSISSVVFEAYHDGEMVQHHTWKFDWE